MHYFLPLVLYLNALNGLSNAAPGGQPYKFFSLLLCPLMYVKMESQHGVPKVR
jgi:hypothetical protein